MLLRDILPEASYEGNIGIAEVTKFFMSATPEQKAKFKRLTAAHHTKSAWDLIYSVIGGPKLKPLH